MTTSPTRLAIGLAALLVTISLVAGCDRAVVCDISVWALGDDVIEPGDPLPADAIQILGTADLDVGQASLGNAEFGPIVDLHLRPEAAERFRAFTASNIGGLMALTLNGTVATVPMIQTEIPDGALRLSLTRDTPPEVLAGFEACITKRTAPEP